MSGATDCGSVIRPDESSTFQMTGAVPVTGTEGVTRHEMHSRHIEMRGYGRSDGLYEVEGRVTDRKPHEFRSPNGVKVVPAGAPIHDMGVRVVFDAALTVRDIGSFTSSAPYGDCINGGERLASLVGLRMAAGWGGEVRKRLSGPLACTHLMELLLPMATTAYQALTMLRAGQPDKLDPDGKPVKIGSCYAYGSEHVLVMHRWPEHYTGPDSQRGAPSLPGPGIRLPTEQG
ncbi:hypothetical protein BH09PSE5_BH09PSE5_37280 [soil metagenome]